MPLTVVVPPLNFTFVVVTLEAASSVRWEEGQKFLVRKYSLQADGEPDRSGTQWIGWDPQAQQIRSWVFDSEGDFGQGQWTRAGDAWIIKSTGVRSSALVGRSRTLSEVTRKVHVFLAQKLVALDDGSH